MKPGMLEGHNLRKKLYGKESRFNFINVNHKLINAVGTFHECRPIILGLLDNVFFFLIITDRNLMFFAVKKK